MRTKLGESFCSWLIAVIFAVSLPSPAMPRLTERQRQALRAAKTAQILVAESYGEDTSTKLPFEETAGRFLELAGIKIVPPEASADLTVEIQVRGVPLRGRYLGGRSCYSGASVQGAIYLKTDTTPALMQRFEGRREVRDFVSGSDLDSSYCTADNAPFRAAYQEESGSFVQTWLDTVGQIFGYAPLLKYYWGSYGGDKAPVYPETHGALIHLKDPALAPALLTGLRQQPGDNRAKAAELLGDLKEPTTVQPLIDSLGDKSKTVRSAVIEALRKIGDRRAVEPLIAALRDPEPDVSRQAIESLRSITGQKFDDDQAAWLEWWRRQSR